MIEKFDEDYEVCNCHKVKLGEIVDVIKTNNIENLENYKKSLVLVLTCRHCIFEEGDFGKMKKKIYCKDIFNEVKYG